VLGVEIPIARGVDIYVFAGPTALNVVQRYNLFSGGGCFPPMWGLGIWYRAYGRADQRQVLALAESFRRDRLPCDVIGLEPGWQSRSYSCSFLWNPELFPEPDSLIKQLRDRGFQVNLWEHIFVHPESPMYPALVSTAGDAQVWGGLVPDLSDPHARAAFTDYHRINFVDKGITGFKLDECDNSDFIRQSSWSFPESSTFPSGLDGEQMHCLLGLLYQRAINDALENAGARTFSSVRSSGAFAARWPFVLYSDLYDHRDFIRGVAVSGFSGLLWTPEVRDAQSGMELLRRIETVILSPQALLNAWYIKNPPWFQTDREKNNADQPTDDAAALTAAVRKLLRLRMSLVPYLYSAFATYHFDGIPPFRALALDYPDDPATHRIDDQYLIGADLLAAPFVAGDAERQVYLPAGQWRHFSTGESYEGRKTHTVAAVGADIPLFVRSGAMIPLAEPIDHIAPNTVFDITMHSFGPAASLRPATLIEDDGTTFAFRGGALTRLTIYPDGHVARAGGFDGIRYRIVNWKRTE
jgi:alpha-D-xyloside xylohydrolase